VCRWRVGDLVKSIGIIGISEGNGHPFSYSAIVNGYSPEGLVASGWPGIYEYVRRRHASEFGLAGWKITHAWTQDPAVTAKLCAAARITHGVAEYHEFLGKVDATAHTFRSRSPFLKQACPSSSTNRSAWIQLNCVFSARILSLVS
jgi:hypothetical protein